MKNRLMKLAAILFIGMSVVACKNAKNEVKASDAEEVAQAALEATQYSADAATSSITWKGFKPAKTHDGTINISEGSFSLEEGKLTGGNFVIDMNSIVNLDIESEEYNAKLVGHLKTADFFDVENHPFSVFTITGVDESEGKITVKGNLNIKGIKKNIEFPAAVSVDGDNVSFVSESFSIDRTEWDIKYKSGKFFEDLKDNFINDNIELAFNVKGTKASM